MILQIVIIICIYDIPAKDDNNISTLKIINFTGLGYGLLLTIVAVSFLYKHITVFDINSTIFATIFLILYLAITISTCVYAYKLPDNNEDKSECEYERYSSVLRTLCVAITLGVIIGSCTLGYVSYLKIVESSLKTVASGVASGDAK
jgi:hypothetical protein